MPEARIANACDPGHPRLHHVRRTDHSSTHPLASNDVTTIAILLGLAIGVVVGAVGGGGAILALRDGFYAFDFETGEAERLHETQPGELRPRMNDGKVDRQGRFLAGSMDFEESEPVGKLFRLDPDLSVHTIDSGIICSNGPCWSPDGKTLYFADTGRKVIWAYDYDTGTGNVRSRRVFSTFERQRGLPDGEADRRTRQDVGGVVDAHVDT